MPGGGVNSGLRGASLNAQVINIKHRAGTISAARIHQRNLRR